MSALRLAVGDGITIARRNVIKIRRVPEILVSVLVSPVVMVVLFASVFGNSITVPGGQYREFLIAGIFAMSVTFGATLTGAGLAEDLQQGIINRFRSLPMSRSAVIVGRTVSDIVFNVLTLVAITGAALAVGWRIHNGIGKALLAMGLLLLFAHAVSWVMAWVGLIVPGPEVVANASLMVIFPLTFLANTFVPSDNLPTPLRIFAEWNPVSAVTQATRELFGNLPAATPEPTAWSLQEPVWYVLAWVVLTIAIFVPLSVRRYRRMSR